MELEMPLPNTMYKTKRGSLVLCMSAHQWVFERKGKDLPEYQLQITTRPVKVRKGLMVQNNKGHFITQYLKKEGHFFEGIPDRLDTTPEDFQMIHKIFQEAQ